MKTITEVVDGLNQEELKDLAIKRLDYLANEEVWGIILLTWGRIRDKKETSGYRNQYELLKQRLEKLDLWNPKYETHYNLALEGKLNLAELKEIRTK